MNYLSRSTLVVAAPTVLQELRIGEREYSWMVGVFKGAIMAQPICGCVLDVLGLKIGFAIFAVTLSLVNMTPAAASRKHIRVMSCLPAQIQPDVFSEPIRIPAGVPVQLRVGVDFERLYFAHRVENQAWRRLPGRWMRAYCRMRTRLLER